MSKNFTWIWKCDWEDCNEWFITESSCISHYKSHVEVICIRCEETMSLSKYYHHNHEKCEEFKKEWA